MPKILAISGGFTNGTNDATAKEALMGAQETGAEIEFVHMLDLELKPCTGCLSCVTGPNGVINGGPGRCIQKDDFLWLQDKIYDADAVIFVMPVFEKMLPGFFKVFEDRFGGPSQDTAMLMAARQIHDARGLTTPGPDPRAFKKRFATYIGIGGSDWTTWTSAHFNFFGIPSGFQAVDNITFNWGKSIIMDDERVAQVHEAGRALARACADPDSYEYLGDTGVCSNCHSRLLYVHDDAKTVECAVCGIKGSFVAKDGKLAFVYPVEQLEHAHNTSAGRSKHLDVVREVEGAFAVAKATDEFRRRAKMYKDFIKASRPGK
jgi:putative NADPH-quinone reductase